MTVFNSIIAHNGSQNYTNFANMNYQGTVISSDWSCGEVGIAVADPMLSRSRTTPGRR